MQNAITLPEYPLLRDMWDEIREEKRPIVVYGMGNGADKLFSRLAEIGVTPSDIFASDGFVRGHSYRGMRVKSFSEIKETYSDFVILLSFASNREEVLEMLTEVDKKYDMYIPDMPVAGTEEYFDKEFYNSNYKDIIRAYGALSDDRSRHIYASVIRYKLTGRMSYLEGAYSTREELYSSLSPLGIECAIDAGAYNGDTAREMKKYLPTIRKIVAVEPDPKTYRRLLRYVEGEGDITVDPVNAGVWCEVCDGEFQSSGNRNSSVNSTASFEYSVGGVKLISIDSLGLRPDYIKYDVEGAEHEALVGSQGTIIRHAPALLVSLYHRSRDIFELINYLSDNHPGYRLSLYRLRCVPAWELDLVAIPTPDKMPLAT